jgi:hypothetical protein
MAKLRDITTWIVSSSYSFGTRTLDARVVYREMLVDNFIDLGVGEVSHRTATQNDTLRANDVVVVKRIVSGGHNIEGVAIYFPQGPSPEPLVPTSSFAVFRPANPVESVSILAALIYRLRRKPLLSLAEARDLEIPLLTEKQAATFLELLKNVHKLRVNMRARDRLLDELIPATVHKFLKDNGQLPEVSMLTAK